MVKIYHYADVQQILEDIVHEMVEGGESIHETVVHDKEFVGAVSCAKGGLPFVLFGYADQVVSAAMVHLSKHAGWRKVGEMKGNGCRPCLVIQLRPQ